MTEISLGSAIQLSSGYAMPRLGFGVYKNYNTTESVLEAFKAGYRHVDSAQAYRNEAHVGAALRQSGLQREDVFLTTKCISKTHGYDKTLRGVNTSLEKFEVDYIDLFLIHNPHSGKDLRLATYRALQDTQKAGKIRTVGVSNFGIKHLEEIREAGYEAPSVNQIELHPFCQQQDVVAYCVERNIVIQAFCPLVHGNLSHTAFQDIAQKHHKDPAQILLRWSLQRGCATPFNFHQEQNRYYMHRFVPLPKSARPERIHSNTLLYDFSLDDGDMARLDALDQGKAGAVSWNAVDVD